MFNRHKHTWKITGKRFVPGLLETGGNFKGHVHDEVIYGYTTISAVCTECGQPTTWMITGQFIDEDTN